MKWESIREDPGRLRARVKILGCTIRGQGTPLQHRAAENKPANTGQLLATAHLTIWLKSGVPMSVLGSALGRAGRPLWVFKLYPLWYLQGSANNSQGAVYQTHSPAPPTKTLWKSLPKLTWGSNRENRIQPHKTCPTHFISSLSLEMAAVEEMTVYGKQRPQELIQSSGWK